MTLALNWFPEAEHGGYYAALVNGYFKEEGLDVEIQPGGPGVPIIQNVATKRVMFGIANADQVLVGRNEQADVVALYLLPVQNRRLIPQLKRLRAGSRIVSHHFEIPGVVPDRIIKVESKESGEAHRLYLFITPLEVK